MYYCKQTCEWNPFPHDEAKVFLKYDPLPLDDERLANAQQHLLYDLIVKANRHNEAYATATFLCSRYRYVKFNERSGIQRILHELGAAWEKKDHYGADAALLKLEGKVKVVWILMRFRQTGVRNDDLLKAVQVVVEDAYNARPETSEAAVKRLAEIQEDLEQLFIIRWNYWDLPDWFYYRSTALRRRVRESQKRQREVILSFLGKSGSERSDRDAQLELADNASMVKKGACEVCRSELGKRYEFYAGEVISSRMTDAWDYGTSSGHIVTTRYRTLGSGAIHICKKCIWTCLLKVELVAVVVWCVLLSLLYFWIGQPDEFFLWLIALCFVAINLVIIPSFVCSGYIDTEQVRLKEKIYPNKAMKFWSPKEYSRLGLKADAGEKRDQELSGQMSGLATAQSEQQPNTAEEYCTRGIAYHKKGDLGRAIQDFSQAISLNPNNVPAYYNRGNTYYEKGDFDRSIQDFNHAISLDPKFSAAYYNRGVAYHNKGIFDQAIQDYSQAISLNPNDAVAYTNRGDAYSKKGDYDRAIQDYNQTISLEPNYAEAYYNRAAAYYQKGDLDGAIRDFTKAISLNPKSALTYRNRAKAYRALGKKDLADADEKKAQELRG